MTWTAPPTMCGRESGTVAPKVNWKQVWEEFEERAGIMEFDANMPRAEAEAKAKQDTDERHGIGKSGGLFDGNADAAKGGA
jgi:hypothetical protein